MNKDSNGQLFDSEEENEQGNTIPEADDSNDQPDVTSVTRKKRKPRSQRSFPAVPFEEALEFALSIQRLAGESKVRRLRLFELLERSPDSGSSRQLIINSSRYGLTTGNYAAEWIELTKEGKIVTSDEAAEREKMRVRFDLAIAKVPPFQKMHSHLENKKLPAKGILIDFLKEEGYNEDETSECVDTFLLNAKFVGVLQIMSGAERIVSLEHLLDYSSITEVKPRGGSVPDQENSFIPSPPRMIEENSVQESNSEDWDNICFYVTPIGADGSEERKHADLFLGSIIEPALEEFGLNIVRADKISVAGIITRQIIEHIVRARLVIADLSFHNPNVFYELALRHSTGLPTVQIMRNSDRIPFDVNQVRTITIDNSSIYALIPQLDVHRSAIASQVRRALENPDEIDNPVTAFYPSLKHGK